jgi:phospholipase/carboxylesterase
VSGMLRFEASIAPLAADGSPLVVLLHGRGADRFDLLGLGPEFADDAMVVTPEAPHPGGPWGYGGGWAWYRYLGGTTPEPEGFEASQRALAEFLEEIPGHLPHRPGRIVLGGFSQGGTMSLAHALREPGSIPRVLNLSGFLPEHPSVRATAATVAGSRFFWGHGTLDPAIPFDFASAGRAALRAAGAELETRDYAMGHGISPEEVADVRAWLGSSPEGEE